VVRHPANVVAFGGGSPVRLYGVYVGLIPTRPFVSLLGSTVELPETDGGEDYDLYTRTMDNAIRYCDFFWGLYRWGIFTGETYI